MEESSMMYQQQQQQQQFGVTEEGWDDQQQFDAQQIDQGSPSQSFQQQQIHQQNVHLLQQQQQQQQPIAYQHYSPYLAQQQYVGVPQQYGIHPQFHQHHHELHYPIMMEHSSSPYMAQQSDFIDQNVYNRYPIQSGGTMIGGPTGYSSPLTQAEMISPIPHNQPSPNFVGLSPAQTPGPSQPSSQSGRGMPSSSSGMQKKQFANMSSMESGGAGGSMQKSITGTDKGQTIKSSSSSTTTSSSTQTGIPSFLPAKPNFVVPSGKVMGAENLNTIPQNNQMNMMRSIGGSGMGGIRSGPPIQHRRNIYGSGGSSSNNPAASMGSTITTSGGSTFQSSSTTTTTELSNAVPILSRLPALPLRPSSDNVSIEELERLYKEREDALILRIEALGFEPESSWKVMEELKGSKTNADDDDDDDENVKRENPSTVLGIRLLQRIDILQKENEELGKLLQDQRISSESESKSLSSSSNLRNELKDSQRLINELDQALIRATKRAELAELKCLSQEKALAIACAKQSSSISDEISSSSSSGIGKGKQTFQSSSAWNTAKK